MSNEEAIYIFNHLSSDNHIMYDPNIQQICISAKLAEALDKAILCLKEDIENE